MKLLCTLLLKNKTRYVNTEKANAKNSIPQNDTINQEIFFNLDEDVVLWKFHLTSENPVCRQYE